MRSPLRILRCRLARLFGWCDTEASANAEAQQLSVARHGLANAATKAQSISREIWRQSGEVVGEERLERFAEGIRGTAR